MSKEEIERLTQKIIKNEKLTADDKVNLLDMLILYQNWLIKEQSGVNQLLAAFSKHKYDITLVRKHRQGAVASEICINSMQEVLNKFVPNR